MSEDIMHRRRKRRRRGCRFGKRRKGKCPARKSRR